jgi:hypothetical protein
LNFLHPCILSLSHSFANTLETNNTMLIWTLHTFLFFFIFFLFFFYNSLSIHRNQKLTY